MTGEAVRVLDRFGRRYAAAVRVVILPPLAGIALFRSSPDEFAVTSITVAAIVGWNVGYAWWLSRSTARHTGPLPVCLDFAVLVGVCLSVFWMHGQGDDDAGWIRLLVTFACVSVQWHTDLVVGGPAAVVAVGSMLATFIVAEAEVTVSHGWALAAAALSRAVWILVTRAAERADQLVAATESARRRSAIAAAERVEERELANSLHDNAATTLLMIGTGQVPPDARWLAPQARRDLARLRSVGEPAPERADLVDLLRADLDVTHLSVELIAPQRLPLSFEVAGAIAGAAGEALNNVRRHAGTDRATLRVRGDERSVRVDVVDQGKGFEAPEGQTTRRGLRESVYGRMSRIGGAAMISSTPGVGTVVRLEWRAAMSDGDD